MILQFIRPCVSKHLEIDILNYILYPLETFPSFSERIQILKISCPVRDVDLCL